MSYYKELYVYAGRITYSYKEDRNASYGSSCKSSVVNMPWLQLQACLELLRVYP